jgi:hypothetical protein
MFGLRLAKDLASFQIANKLPAVRRGWQASQSRPYQEEVG